MATRVLESNWTIWNALNGTRYYVIDKVNGDINAIHDESIKLMEFKGHFRPFNLDNLEAKVCRLAHGKDEEDITEQQNAQELCFTDPRTQNMEEYESMGFDENNCSPIPPVNRASSQNITPRPTLMPKPEDEQILNSSNPTHNRGKVNRVNSFNTAQEWAATALKNSKGGLLKTSGTKRVNHNLVAAIKLSHAGHNYIALPAEDVINSERTVVRMSSAATAGQDHMLWKCAEPHHNKSQVILYVYIVVVQTTAQVDVIVNQTTTEKNQDHHLETLGTKDPGQTTAGWVNHKSVTIQIRFNEGLNRQH